VTRYRPSASCQHGYLGDRGKLVTQSSARLFTELRKEAAGLDARGVPALSHAERTQDLDDLSLAKLSLVAPSLSAVLVLGARAAYALRRWRPGQPMVRHWISYPRATRTGAIGAKPAPFAFWLLVAQGQIECFEFSGSREP
jgi:hypothetical protein